MSNIIFITGASSDIGVGLIKNIVEECVIVAHYNSNEERLLEAQKETKNKIITIQADFSSTSSVVSMLDEIENNIGIPNKIIHLASPKFENIRFRNVNWSDFEKELTVSLGSITQILNRFLPKMAIQKRGKVLTILSSVTIGVPPKALAQYTSVKYAVLGLMKALASEYASKNIAINCISPSMVETQFLSLLNERIVEFTAESHPLKRNATVSDLISVMLMLISDETTYINGVNIPVTGGSNF
ncbi:SDR family oxidoreductase [uncultured Tenacibaculum sp.]|uniref:SDR family NAD(P)-dependent oxidoreductase n=1 Tax=uncultured Tenacibaculum sp. TaxID=174713 RepID=UPI00262EC5FA|nr:SDR family oxidoreductase [uncultured Tenacibaculum sp.]